MNVNFQVQPQRLPEMVYGRGFSQLEVHIRNRKIFTLIEQTNSYPEGLSNIECSNNYIQYDESYGWKNSKRYIRYEVI
jgi:hypothetical protein